MHNDILLTNCIRITDFVGSYLPFDVSRLTVPRVISVHGAKAHGIRMRELQNLVAGIYGGDACLPHTQLRLDC